MYENKLKFSHTNYIIYSANPYTLFTDDSNGLCHKLNCVIKGQFYKEIKENDHNGI